MESNSIYTRRDYLEYDFLAADVLEARCYPAGLSSTGKVKAGFITLRCRWCQSMLYSEPVGKHNYRVRYSMEGLGLTTSLEARGPL